MYGGRGTERHGKLTEVASFKTDSRTRNLSSINLEKHVRFEVFAAVTMKNAVTPWRSCKNRRFGGKYRIYHQGYKNLRARKNVGRN
jgi:hypothetical protein